MSKKATHLIVAKGRQRGLQIHVPAKGARLGRSSKNDVTILDPSLSRHHCRLFFKDDGSLWVTDLGSSNETVVNDQPIQEQQLNAGDHITLGDTVLTVVNNGLQQSAAAAGQVDLGLNKLPGRPEHAKFSRNFLLLLALLVVGLAAAVWIPKFIGNKPQPVADEKPEPMRLTSWPVEIEYEKVEANNENIFRYHLQLHPDRTLAVQIDDIQNDRHVRKEKQVDEDYIRYLAHQLESTGFFSLAHEYQGLQPAVLESRTIMITIGRRAHRTEVVNRLEPDIFAEVRSLIEEMGKHELGLWAIQFSAEKLVEMARDAYLLGKKHFDEQEVNYGNLFSAIKSLEEAEWYLETVEPKPDFYGDIIATRTESRERLSDLYRDQNFRAKRAIRLRQWDQAANELRIILEMIPDRSDPRHTEAREELIEIENRLRLENQ